MALVTLAKKQNMTLAEIARRTLKDLITEPPVEAAMSAIGKGLTLDERAVLNAPAPANGMKRQTPILEHNGVVNPVHLPAKTATEGALRVHPKDLQVLQALRVPGAVDKPHFFYHPESDSYVTIPEAELPAFRNSQDGALCVEMPLVGGIPGIEDPPVFHPKEEAPTVVSKPATTWSYRKFKEAQKKS
jgi:hypothetical protein